MIEYIHGQLTELTPNEAVAECGGVGYGLSISVNTYQEIQGKKEVKLYVYEQIRDDAHTLYGFSGKDEREIFLHLISVPGIGCASARTILSSFSPAELSTIIASGDDKMLKTVKGIGTKTAQRIIVDLKDKIADLGMAGIEPTNTLTTANTETHDEAVSALITLGYTKGDSSKVVGKILSETPDIPLGKIIKEALRRI